MTQTPRQMRKHAGEGPADTDAARKPRGRGPTGGQRRGPSRAALFAAMIVVFVAGLFAAPFAQYYLGPRLAELSGIAELAAGGSDVADFNRLRAVEARTDELGRELQSIGQTADDGSGARIGALENELGLLRQDLASLTELTERTAALESSAASLAALDSRLAGLEARPLDTAGDDIAGVNARLADVDTALEAVRGESERLAATVDALQLKLAEDVKSALALVDSRLAAVDQSRGVDRALAETVDDLQARTSVLEGAVDRSEGRMALAAAIGALRGAAERGRPFEAELQTVRALMTEHRSLQQLDGPIETLARSAGTGLPSLVGLQRSFAVLAGRAARPASTGDAGWIGQTLNRVGSLVTVRRTGEISGQSPEAVVARAEVRLQAGDLAGAVAEMTTLEGQLPENDAWLARARLRLAAERALDALNAGLVAIGGAG